MSETLVLPPPVETPHTPLEEMPDPNATDGDGKGRWHWARYPFKHAICGVPLPRIENPPPGPHPDCAHCLRIMHLWLDHGIWEGFGKRRPGKDATDEMRWEIEDA